MTAGTETPLSLADAVRMIAETGVALITENKREMETVITLNDGCVLTVAPGDYYPDCWTIANPESTT